MRTVMALGVLTWTACGGAAPSGAPQKPTAATSDPDTTPLVVDETAPQDGEGDTATILDEGRMGPGSERAQRPWDTDLPGAAYEPAAPGAWAALMRPGAAWTLRDTARREGNGGAEVRLEVTEVSHDKAGHTAVLSWRYEEFVAKGEPAFDADDESPPPETYLGQAGSPSKIRVGAKGVWFDGGTGWTAKPTFTTKQVKAGTKGDLVCLDLGPPPGGEEACGDETCAAVLCVHASEGVVAGMGRGWPSYGEFRSRAGEALTLPL